VSPARASSRRVMRCSAAGQLVFPARRCIPDLLRGAAGLAEGA